jgi:FKBP-type peptidyl-prolyl cis-trans isomerase FklB
MQFLEQTGVIESTSEIEYEYQMKISAVEDSIERQNLEKEMKAKIDSLNKVNAPKLNDFVKGLKEALNAGKEKSAYIQGLSIGHQIAQQMLPEFNKFVFGDDSTKRIKTDPLLAGLAGVIKNEDLALGKMDANMYIQKEIQEAQNRQMAKQEEQLKEQYKDSIAAGEKFLAENAQKEGVITLPSGLQYEIIKRGSGPIPTDTDRVRVLYEGKLLDGTVFDSSLNRNDPAIFGVTQVIPGWTEALKMMPVGSKWRIYVPYDLAYGSQDRGTIKPFSTLIFEVELLGIEK